MCGTANDLLLPSETLFVGEDLQYLGPNVHMAIPLGPRDRRGEDVVIPCVPVGRTPAGDYNAEWMFSTERGNFETVITAGPHPRDGAAGVSFGNVAGTNGSITKGLLRIGSLFPSVAGYYLCTLSSGMTEVANNTALLYCEWGGCWSEGKERLREVGRGEVDVYCTCECSSLLSNTQMGQSLTDSLSEMHLSLKGTWLN